MSEFTIHQVTPDEFAILNSLVQRCPGAMLSIAPNHCLDETGCLQGFLAQYPADTLMSALPVNRQMFYGTSMYEVDTHASAIKSGLPCEDDTDDTFLLQLLMSVPSLKDRLHQLLCSVDQQSLSTAADIECCPDYLGSCNDDCVDAKVWTPELPEFAGLYHAYVRGFHKQDRVHKLFIVVNGGCQKACDQFYNLCCDVGTYMTVRQVYDSDEVWWVKRACSRARGMLACMIAKEFGLVVKTSLDTFAKDPANGDLAQATTETIYNDLQYDQRTNTVTMYNHCCNTNKSKNGILCCMHASEGVWLFRGPPQTNSGFSLYGSAWGNSNTQKVPFPTNVVRIHPKYPVSTIHPTDNSARRVCMVSNSYDRHVTTMYSAKNDTYIMMDDVQLQKLKKMGWDVDNGIIELMPAATVFCNHNTRATDAEIFTAAS